jgi:TonB-linked SusC/RagA family outer membrane protein
MTKLYLSLCRYAVLLLVLAANVAYGQSKAVKGKVTSSDDGSSIPGVNIIEKGTSNGTVTDVDGNYSINVSDGATLVFTFVGFTSQEIAVGTQTTISVAMSADVQSLTEVVVVGYGTQEKKEITSSVASVKAEDFNKGTVNNPMQLLQGKVAGLNISRAGGDPNGSFNVRLRGVGTIGANVEPLVVIDGVIGGSLSTVDPNDIASMDVLKDGSAAAIYGSRGGSGVILVTTKSGKSGRVMVDYNGSYAIENVANSIDVMTAEEYRQVPGHIDLGASTDWLDVVTRQGTAMVHNLSLSGGTPQTTYRASINVRNTEGVGIKSGFDQFNGRLNLSQKALKDRATITLNFSSTQKDAQEGNTASFNYAVLANPTMPVYDNTLTSPTAGAAYGGYAERAIFDFFNPLSIVELNERDKKQSSLLVSLRGEYDFTDFIDGLRASAFYSAQEEEDLYGASNAKTSKFGGRGGLGGAGRAVDKRYNELFETTVNYDKTFGAINAALLGGYSYQYFFNEGFGASGGNFLTDAFTYNNLGAALDFDNGLGDVYSYANSNKLVAFFGRLNLTFFDNFYLSASVRREGSSRFGANEKWGTFPAASAGVNLTNLFEIPAVNSLKLRASYGVTGTQPGNSYISLQRFGRTGSFFYNGAYGPSYGPISNPNPDLKWESKSEIDFGFDFAMLDSRLTGTFDWYQRTTKDMIVPVNVPVPPNLYSQTELNLGELRNSGFELSLNFAAITKPNFTWSVGGNVGTYDTEVISLKTPDGNSSIGEGGVLYRASMGAPGQSAVNLVRVKEGSPLGDLWGLVYNGVNGDGNYGYVDINGDGVISTDNDDDKTVIGNGLPTATVGFNNSFTFKHFDLNIFLNGAFGHDLLNSYRGFYENNETTTVNNWNIVTTKYYDPSVTKANVNSHHVEKASFVRLNNASLGYNFPVNKGGLIRNFRIYVAGQNLFTITDYTGVDPEVRYMDTDPEPDDGLASGIERRSTYFTTRTYTFGVNLGF